MRSVEFLEKVKVAHKMRNDHELAVMLQVTPAAISQYKSGKRMMDNETCVAIALALNIDPIKVIMAADLDKAERAGQKSLWEVFSTRAATAASLILGVTALTLFLTLAPEPAQAAALHSKFDNNTNYAKIKRWLFTVIARLKRMAMPSALEPATA
jgi:transcriptional regulator with XRE-family HTH domain